MRNSRLFALSALALLVMAFVGLVNLGSRPATSVEALREATPRPSTTTTVDTTTTERAELALLTPDLTDLGTTTSSTVPPTTTTEAAEETASDATTATTEPRSGGKTTTTEPSIDAGPSPDAEAGFASRINSFRADNGLAELRRDGSLDARARKWSERIADNGSLSHSDLGSLLPPWSAAGENVGMGGSVGGVFGALVDSPGHRDNMLGDYTHFGVGVWIDSEGTIWTTHVFTR